MEGQLPERGASGPLSSLEALAAIAGNGTVFATETTVVDGVTHTVFSHAPRTLGEVYSSAAPYRERPFLIYEDERHTFAGVQRMAHNLAHHLVHELGVQRGDRVAFAMRNYPEWCVLYMAVTSIGAVAVPLNAWWKGPELDYALRDCAPRVAVFDEERLERVAPKLPDLVDRFRMHTFVVRGKGARLGGRVAVEPLAPLLEGSHELPSVEVGGDDDASIMYTSGSTGHPKGVIATHRSIVSAVFTWEGVAHIRALAELDDPAQRQAIIDWAHRGVRALHEPLLGLTESAMLVTVPLFHVTGCNVQFLPSFRVGRKLVLMHKWDPERALELIERERITDFNGVPSMSWDLVNSPDFARRDVSSLRTLSAGGAARPAQQVRTLREKSPAKPSIGYGMTETGGVGCAIGGNDYEQRPGSAGRPLLPLVTLKIVDPIGEEVRRGIEGEIWIKSVTNMRGYWNQPDATAETLCDGWIVTGDAGYMDEDGFVYITGRKKEIIIRGGENISAAEVERVLSLHTAVFEAAVYATSDERLGEAVTASVMLRKHAPDVTGTELMRFCAEHLASFKVPSQIFVQRDPLPRVASGKVDKLTLRADAEKRRSGTRVRRRSGG